MPCSEAKKSEASALEQQAVLAWAPGRTQAPAATSDCNWVSGVRLRKYLALCLLPNACLLPGLNPKNTKAALST